MEAQESRGRTWQLRIFWGDLFLAFMVKISPMDCIQEALIIFLLAWIMVTLL
jgi:hypothetical protein